MSSDHESRITYFDREIPTILSINGIWTYHEWMHWTRSAFRDGDLARVYMACVCAIERLETLSALSWDLTLVTKDDDARWELSERIQAWNERIWKIRLYAYPHRRW